MADSLLKKILKFIKTNEVAITIALGFLIVVGVGLMIVGKNWWRETRRPRIDQQAASTVFEPSGEPQLSIGTDQLTPLKKDILIKQEELVSPRYYTVQKGDSTWKLAKLFYGNGGSYINIEKANNLRHNQQLEVGQKLVIPQESPAPSSTPSDQADYVVKSGDCLWTIAQEQFGSGYKWVDIYQANRQQIGHNPHLIYPGTHLRLSSYTK